MESTAFDSDEILTDFLTDYIDGNLDETEKSAFEDYLENHPKEKEFARNTLRGKRALSRLARHINNRADIEARSGLSAT